MWSLNLFDLVIFFPLPFPVRFAALHKVCLFTPPSGYAALLKRYLAVLDSLVSADIDSPCWMPPNLKDKGGVALIIRLDIGYNY